MATVIELNPARQLQARILATLRARPMTAVELAAFVPVPYRQIVAALPGLIERGKVKQVGYRYRLALSEEPEGDDAA